MANSCVSCGTEIPDECGSMVCSHCLKKLDEIELSDMAVIKEESSKCLRETA